MYNANASLISHFCITIQTVYFGGVSEFSSIFLCISQAFQYYPPTSLVPSSSALYTIFPTIEAFSQAMFVLTFFAFRIVGWAIMSYKFLMDGAYVIKNGLLKRYSPGSGWFLWYLMTMSGLLGALQVFWFGEIVKKIMDIMNS